MNNSYDNQRRASNLKWHHAEYWDVDNQHLFMLFLFAHIKVLKK